MKCLHKNTTIVEVEDMDDVEVCDDCNMMLNDDEPDTTHLFETSS